MGDNLRDAVTYLPASLVRAVTGLTTCERSAASAMKVEPPWHVEVDGTMVMADLSGFTALSERLARLGDEGAERLTDIINSFFQRMLKTASRYGGDTLTFGGDAILLLFDGREHATRAAVAALEMLRQVERAAAVDTDDGKVKIGMSVGAHSGRFVLAGVGLADERAHLVVLGRGAERTALAEAQAERSQLAVSSACRDLLPDGAACTTTGDYWRVDEPGARALPRVTFERPPISNERLRQLDPFLPPYARASGWSDGERAQLAPEHRRAVIVFVNILGLSDLMDRAGIGAAVEQLQAYTAMLTRLASKHRGFVVSSDIATEGSKLVVTFGAPMAHEYAAANAARFALDLNAELRWSGPDLSHKVGVNGGHVFAGEVGPPFRRQYTVMGDAVNLAARLMAAAAPGEVLARRDLLRHAGPALCAREKPSIRVKGKERPVAVCVLEEQGRAGHRIRSGETQIQGRGSLFGRRSELDLLAQSWERACRGTGRTVAIVGEAGVGKTRLLEQALRPMSQGSLVTRASCFEHLQAAPFTPCIELLDATLGISRSEPTSRRTEKVRAYLETHAPHFIEFQSLLDPLLNLSLTQSDVVGSLDAQARRQKLFELIATILAEAGGERGHVIVVEDVHWVDESSLALVRYLAEQSTGTRILLLLTTRPTDSPLDLGRAEVTRMDLAELTEAESLAMVREALGVADLSAEIGEAIYAKTKGNPLFVEEVVRSLQAPGVLERILGASSVTRAAELAALEIPDRVQGLLMSRVDQLSPDTREVLKAGSVVGRSFDESTLAGIDDEVLASVALHQAFDELLRAALVVRDEGGAGSPVAFRHALVQEVAYESLPFSRRRDLHGRVARYLEVNATPDHGLLVHHYRHAGDAQKTRLHAVKASASSVAVYANREAVDYLTVALATARGRTARDACLRSRFEELMGDSLETLARHDEAIECFTRARRRWASPAVAEISEVALSDLAPIDDAAARDGLLCWKIAVAFERGRSAYGRALRWVDRGTATLPARSTGLKARMNITKGATLSRLGRFRQAVEFGEEGVRLARQDGEAALQAYALTVLGYTLDSLGLLRKAIDCNVEAIALYEQAGDLYGLAISHENVANSCMLIGDLQAALEHDEVSLAFFARIGNIGGVAMEHVNLGGVLLQRGEVAGALEHFNEAIGLRAHQGVNPMVTGYALVQLSQALVWSGDLASAERALAEGLEILEGIDAQGLLLDAGVVHAELHLAQGDLGEADGICRRVLSQAHAMGAELNEVQGLCMLGQVQLARGDPGAAIPGLESCIELAQKSGFDYERARALAVLAEARASCARGDEACVDLLTEAVRLFEKMGARLELKKAAQVLERLRGTPATAARSRSSRRRVSRAARAS